VALSGDLLDVASAAARLPSIVDVDIDRALEFVLAQALARDRVLHS
jgi:hypothetical protein